MGGRKVKENIEARERLENRIKENMKEKTNR